MSAFAPRSIEDDPREVAESICRAWLVDAWLVIAVGDDEPPDAWAGHGERVIVVQRAEVVSGSLPSTRVPGGSPGTHAVVEAVERLRIREGLDRLEVWTTGVTYWTCDSPAWTSTLVAA